MNDILHAGKEGYACLSSWTDLLDSINVFPVPDGDTGTNLKISLAPLQQSTLTKDNLSGLLLRTASGNSGNIAVAFLQPFLQAENLEQLRTTAATGLRHARKAMLEPRSGTMLDVFAALSAYFTDLPPTNTIQFRELSSRLQESVRATSDILPELQGAGVVDAGALGMFIFFQGFLNAITHSSDQVAAITDLFAGKLVIAPSWIAPASKSYCITVKLAVSQSNRETFDKQLKKFGKSIVINEHGETLHLHIHSRNPDKLRSFLQTSGTIQDFSCEHMASQSLPHPLKGYGPVHIMTDAAGSLDRKTAATAHISLQDSYIISGDAASPESLLDPTTLYNTLKKGNRVTTAQASTIERHQQYKSAIEQYENVVYLCVGSAFTGNYATALAWKKEHDPNNLFYPMDSGAASGRLAIIALLTARFAQHADKPQQVIRKAERLCQDCREYVFLDTLKYLVAGGRISRFKAMMGDFLHKKPIITPMPEGVKTVGFTKNRTEQVAFALKALTEIAPLNAVVLLQYSDNKSWLCQHVLPEVQKLQPQAEILFLPLSLTSGVHMGPGTWAIAFYQEK